VPWTLEADDVSLIKPYRHIAVARRSIGHVLEAVHNQRDCAPLWGTGQRSASKPTSSLNHKLNYQRRPLRGSFLNEFSEAWGNLSRR